MRPTKFTPEVAKTILAYVRAGAFDHVASEAAGISRQTLLNWQTDAAAKGRRSRYALFVGDLAQARAQARLAAETDVRKENPLAWLRYGPGRDRPGAEGWTESQKVEHSGSDGAPIAHSVTVRIEHADD